MERYFQKNRKVRTKRPNTGKAEALANAHFPLTQDEESTGARGRGGRRARGGGGDRGLIRGDSSVLNSSADNSMQETPIATPPSGLTNGAGDGVDLNVAVDNSRDVSRASSVERDTEDETAAPAAAAAAVKRQSRRNGGHVVLPKKLKVSISKLNSEEEERGGGGSSSGSGGDQGKAPLASAVSSKPEIESESSNDASIFDLSAVVSKPIKMTLDAQTLLQNGQDDLR